MLYGEEPSQSARTQFDLSIERQQNIAGFDVCAGKERKLNTNVPEDKCTL